MLLYKMKLPAERISFYFCLLFIVLGFPNTSTAEEEVKDFEFNYLYGAPLIIPKQTSVILELNASFNLTCEANEPIFWRLPNESLNFTVREFKPSESSRSHGLELLLFNANYLNVGYYFCVKKKAVGNTESWTSKDFIEIANQNNASHFYIYVNDTDHLLADPETLSLEAFPKQEFIIPCKPTMPDVEVLVTSDNIELSSKTSKYDPKRGFFYVLENALMAQIVDCIPKEPSVSNPSEYHFMKLTLMGPVAYINPPEITSPSHGHVIENESFNLTCSLKIDDDVRFTVKWITPSGLNQSRLIESKPKQSFGHGSGTLTVINATKSDSGIYKCIVTDHSNNVARDTYTITVLRANEAYIDISEPSNKYDIRDRANTSITMTVKYRGHPWPTLRWYGPDEKEIIHSNKHNIDDSKDTSSTLRIENSLMTDSGIYTVEAKNINETKQLKFNVTVADVPTVSVKTVYVQIGDEADIICNIISYPPSDVYFTFTKCKLNPRWPTCEETSKEKKSSSSVEKGPRIIDFKHHLKFKAETPGIVRCYAHNSMGNRTAEGQVLVGDISGNMTIHGVDNKTKIAVGDEVILTCGALAYFYTGDLTWYKDNNIVTSNEDIEITNDYSKYSYKQILRFKSIKNVDRGNYECRARNVRDPNQMQKIRKEIFVYDPVEPKIIETNLHPEETIERKIGDRLELKCVAEAIPRATIDWYKDDEKINIIEKNHLEIVDENTKLIIKNMKPGDEGTYKCKASNRHSVVHSSVSVIIIDLPGLGWGWISGIISFIILLLILVVYLGVRVHRERKWLQELKAAGLEHFEEGAMEQINPALSLDEQADLLPYDRNFEFPRDKLKLGKQLGAGAFGVVLKAHAEGIKPDEKESIVAVKMVKRTADNEVMRALVTELKIMVHLGQHLNVVNLLGAVTKNIMKKDLMVIVEYCRYGNVQNVLMKNRKSFIDQINPETGKIDSTIIVSRFSNSFEKNRKSEGDPRYGTRAGRPNSGGYFRESDLYEGKVDSCHTVMTTVPEDEENIISNNSVQPGWRSNYKPDSNETMIINTSDLVSWAFQVARGMDYLSSRRVLHGDLAARNILLCEDNVVKICDFGLARTMYNSNNYKKHGEAPLPVKWLALESLSDQVFSTYTDVWSFGVVLWEFFSLAKVPYTGMDANENLYLKLKDGYRMEKPPFANDELYDIMLECWRANPESRPLFNVLEKRFGRMLSDEVTNHYMDLNEPYLRGNNEWIGRAQLYLPQQPGSPEEIAPPPPRYVNARQLPEIQSEPRSPTLINNLDTPSKKNVHKDDVEPEEIPMLQTSKNMHELDEYEDNSRIVSVPMPSPRHQITETKLNDHGNYINIKNSPQKLLNLNKNSNNNGRVVDAFSNPGYRALKTMDK